MTVFTRMYRPALAFWPPFWVVLTALSILATHPVYAETDRQNQAQRDRLTRDAEPRESEAGAEDDEKDGADREAEETARLEEITVRARRAPHEGLGVRIIERREIEALGAKRSAEILDAQPAVQTGENSRGERVFTLRGFDQRQVMVLLDGFLLTVPYRGRLDLGKIPASVVDRVEIVKGGGSAVFGPGGMGGSVNIITRRAGSDPVLVADYEQADILGQSLSLSYSDRHKALRWLTVAGFDRSEGFRLSNSFSKSRNENGGIRDNSDRFDWHWIGKGALEISPRHEIKGSVLVFQGEYGVPRHVSGRTPRYWRWTDWLDLHANLSHEGRYNLLLLKEAVYAVWVDNTLDSYDDDRYETQESPRAFQSTYHDNMIGGRLTHQIDLKPPRVLRLVLRGIDDLRFDTHAEDWRKRGSKPRISKLNTSLMEELELGINRFVTALCGIEVDQEQPVDFPPASDDSPAWFWGPTAEVRVYPHQQVAVEMTAARRGRFPTLAERFSTVFDRRIPNPDLGPEKSWNFGLDLSWRPLETIRLQAGGFDSEVSDLISEVPVGEGRTQQQNLDRVRLTGAEIDTGFDFDFGFSLKSGYAYLHARRLEKEAPDDKLEYRPEHKAYLFVREAPIRWLALQTRLQVVGPQPFINIDTARWGRLGTYAVLNARVDLYPDDGFHLWLRVTNLLDLSYQPTHGYPGPGRTLWFGLSMGYPSLPHRNAIE